LKKPLPMISTKSLNPFFKVPDYGNSNCDMPANRHCPAFAG